MMRTRTVSSARGGFTLLEIVIAAALLSILAGVAVPVASKAFTSKARRTTRIELDELATSATEYFRDTFQLPAKPEDLMADPGVSGWMGPYVTTSYDEPFTGMTDYDVDAWARPYRFSAGGTSTMSITSAGADGVFGTSADLEVRLDVTPVRREATLELLETVNQAITLYNGQYLPDDPLPTDYDALLRELVRTGFLPASAPYSLDGWGDSFQSDPQGASPVVRVGSPNLRRASPAPSDSTDRKRRKTRRV